MGGEAVANGDDVSSTGRARSASINTAVETFGDLDVVVNNAGILRDRMLTNMTEEEWDAVIKVHLKGTFGPARWAAAYWRERSKAGEDERRPHHQHHVAVGHLRQRRPDQLRRGQGRHRRLHDHRRHGARRATASPSTPSPRSALTRMTEGLGMAPETDEERKEQLSPRWIAPIVTWLASPESTGVTGRVFEASGRALAVAEGWHRGPDRRPGRRPDPARRRSCAELVAEARPNADMDGDDGPGRSLAGRPTR